MRKLGLLFMAGGLSVGLVNAYATRTKASNVKYQQQFHYSGPNGVTFTGTRTAAVMFYGCT